MSSYPDQAIRRRRPRIKGILPVRIWGIDHLGVPFSEHSCTANISLFGASLVGVRAALSEGDTISLQYRNRQARFRVVWILPARGASEKHVGLEGLAPEKVFWPVSLPSEGPASPDKPHDSRDRHRTQMRFPVTGTAYVCALGTAERSAARVGKISLNGCYLQTDRPNCVGHRLRLWVRIGHTELETMGVVRFWHPGSAMGIEFTFMSNADRHTLERLIAGLSEGEAGKQVQ